MRIGRVTLALGLALGGLLAGGSAQLHLPALLTSALLSLWVGLGSTLISCALVMAAVAALDRRSAALIWLRRLLAPFLAVPHAAAAVGLAFLLAPAGWINRGLSALGVVGATPPDYLFPHDPLGLSLILGLVLKETPFLFLMLLSQLPHARPEPALHTVQSLGYGRSAAFCLTVAPAAYRLIRLPVLAVLAYGIGGVEMALVLGPGLPPVLPVQVLSWWSHAGLGRDGLVLIGALALLLTTLVGFGIWIGIERALGLGVTAWAMAGHRAVALDAPLRLVTGLVLAVMGLVLTLSMAGLVVWSVAGLWSWPEPWPGSWTLRHWTTSLSEARAATTATLVIAVCASLLAMLISWLVLSHAPLRPMIAEKVIWLPLLLPQVVLVPALYHPLVRLGLDGRLGAVIAAHVIFVLPYVHLCLAGPYRSMDQRLIQTAAALGMPPWRIAWRIRLPMLLTSLILALAVGMAVSIAQYLPTLIIGGGRIRTITTETLALSAGMNRRIVGVYATLQALLPCVLFALALGVPRLLWRRRKGMRP